MICNYERRFTKKKNEKLIRQLACEGAYSQLEDVATRMENIYLAAAFRCGFSLKQVEELRKEAQEIDMEISEDNKMSVKSYVKENSGFKSTVGDYKVFKYIEKQGLKDIHMPVNEL